MNTINEEFLNDISKKDFVYIGNFNFANQFSNINESDIIVFELYYNDITKFYRGPMFYVVGISDKEVIRFYRTGGEPDDLMFYLQMLLLF